MKKYIKRWMNKEQNNWYVLSTIYSKFQIYYVPHESHNWPHPVSLTINNMQKFIQKKKKKMKETI